MTGVSGTSHTGAAHYYYYCSNARNKKTCHKKQVNRDWLEDLVVRETVAHILQDDQIEFISEKCYTIQLEDRQKDAELIYLEKQIVEKKKAIENTLRAIESGVTTKSLPQRLKQLEDEQEHLEAEIRLVSATHVMLTQEHIQFMLSEFREPGPDEDWEAYKRKIIKSFVSSVYLFDDELHIVYNVSHNKKTLDKSEISLLEARAKGSTEGKSPAPR